jgi:LysR family glycine cleavage system transcriptional activator
MSRLPLTALQAFEAVAAQQSFIRAAQQLHVTPAAISQQIRALESLFGYPLFDRSGKSICLTPDGARLLPGVRRGFEELRHAVEKAKAAQAGNRLNVTMLPSFLQRWLLPRLPEFQTRNPGIDLRLSASTSLVNFAHGDFDAGIRFGRGRWPGLHSTKLFDEWLVPVCHPDVLRRHGVIAQASDLMKFALLHGDDEPWEVWTQAAFGKRARLPQGPRVDDSASIVAAAERGHGLALARWSLVATGIDEGRLVYAAPAAVQFDSTSYLVTPPARKDLKSVRAFREWLLAAGAAFPKPACRLVSPAGDELGRRPVKRRRAPAQASG